MNVHFGPAFSSDLWAWQVSLAAAASGRVEVVWKTSALGTRAEREHRFRARSMPDWWLELSDTFARVRFELLPPSQSWGTTFDDAATLSVELEQDAQTSSFSLFFAPKYWPALPDQTREALQHIVAMLDPIARALHES